MASPTCLARAAPVPMLRSVARNLLTTPTKRTKIHVKGKHAGKKIFATARCALTPAQVEKCYSPLVPLRMKRMFVDFPAHQKWIEQVEVSMLDPDTPPPKYKRGSKNKPTTMMKTKLNTEYLQQWGDMTVPLERSESHPQNGTSFERFEAPFSLLLEFMKDKKTKETYRLYLAQHSLADLPEGMRADLPMPDIMKSIGFTGDVYGSSLWMGRPPTRTPLHRDPNPNLLVQVAGKKTVRLMRPQHGEMLYEKVKAQHNLSGGSANIRGEEMMQGKQFDALEKAVWDDTTYQKTPGFGVEVTLKKGDGIFIPKGWWHAVRGEGNSSNISVNWWYR